ncbi:thiopurine S-methyltransferase [Methylomonas sp. 11b]|uniref:thiopurine S-methyltransferase n=1 Tax=Methylomonas sp. 11b TaxID=1168169 RepID=UPI000478B0A4|nr:thiopurine S-methyltransferase [Methylomonas sp. 11b]
MTGRDNALWLQFWRDRRTDFHQIAVNSLLAQFWPSLHAAPGSRVFVPLCGKSLDMLWLVEQGHQVIGVELSEVAVKAFFKENRLRPVRRRLGKFTLWRSGRLSILCGDYFALSAAELGKIDTVYDRAALTALPEDIRGQYVSQLRRIVPETATILLLTAEDLELECVSDETDDVSDEIIALYGKDFMIELSHVQRIDEADSQAFAAGEAGLYKVYQLSGKTPSQT